MTWHRLSPAAQDTFLLTLAWRRWWWRCGGLLCPIWSAGSPISARPKPGGREAVAIAATTSTKATSICGCVFYWCVPLFSLFLFRSQLQNYLCIKQKQYCTDSSQIFPAYNRPKAATRLAKSVASIWTTTTMSRRLGLGISGERCGVQRSKCGAALDGANPPYSATQARVRNPRL